MILETRNDGVRFTHSALRTLSGEYQVLREQYTSSQAAVVEEVLNITGQFPRGSMAISDHMTPFPGGYADPMNALSDLLAQLDVFVR